MYKYIYIYIEREIYIYIYESVCGSTGPVRVRAWNQEDEGTKAKTGGARGLRGGNPSSLRPISLLTLWISEGPTQA